MGDEFKKNLETFLTNIILKIGDKTYLPQIQTEYETLIDSCNIILFINLISISSHQI